MVTDDMVALVPQLHTFARSLCRDGAVRADDLVQGSADARYQQHRALQARNELEGVALHHRA